MALQGTLETFELPDVLRLLSSTKKTGLLELEGDRGVGRVWVADGAVVAARSDREQQGDVEAVLFDMLRFDEGAFVFEPGARPDVDGDSADVETVLDAAQALLADWREIASVVPSLDVYVRLVTELDAESIQVDADQWRLLALIGAGSSGHRLSTQLEQGEIECCRQLAGMVQAGMVEIADDVPETAHEQFDRAAIEIVDGTLGNHDVPAFVDHDLSTDEVASLGANLASFVSRADDDQHDQHDQHDEPVPAVQDVPDVDDEIVLDVDAEPDAGPDVEPVAEPDVEDDGDEFLSQLANLSPKAAAAIEATAEVGERPTAIDELPGSNPELHVATDDDDVNRNLLLKFLSSAKS